MEDVSIQFLIAIWFIVWIISSIAGAVMRGIRHINLMEQLSNIERILTGELQKDQPDEFKSIQEPSLSTSASLRVQAHP